MTFAYKQCNTDLTDFSMGFHRLRTDWMGLYVWFKSMSESPPQSSSLIGIFLSTLSTAQTHQTIAYATLHFSPMTAASVLCIPRCGGQADLSNGGWVLWYTACVPETGCDTLISSLSWQAPAADLQGVSHHYPLQMIMDSCQHSLSSVTILKVKDIMFNCWKEMLSLRLVLLTHLAHCCSNK